MSINKSLLSDESKETLILVLKYIGYVLAIIVIIFVSALLSALTKKRTKLSSPKPPTRRRLSTNHYTKTRQRRAMYARKYGGSRYK